MEHGDVELERLKEFWREDRVHEGDPRRWPTHTLKQFLVIYGLDAAEAEQLHNADLVNVAGALLAQLHDALPIIMQKVRIEAHLTTAKELNS